jgi:TonB family protein
MTAIAQALSAALLDFVWQGMLLAFLLWAALFILKNRSPRARYAASCVALAAMAILPVVTACILYHAPAASHAAVGCVGAIPRTIDGASTDLAGSPAGWSGVLASWALPLWSIGVLFFSLRLVWAGLRISALRRQALPAAEEVLAIVAGVRDRLKLGRPVRVLISAAVDCPSVIGWVRPALLLPAATVLGLTSQQLEAVLAHELAHILRYDYLVNMLQSVVETLLFYHPAVWWASARMRHERELCCDDLAVGSCGDALCYARALTRLERLRASTPKLAMGSAGGPLLSRIQRLTGDAGRQRGPSKLPGILALSLGLICFALNMQWARGQQPIPPAAELPALESVAEDTGVHVDLGGARVIHRRGVEYPERAMEKRIQGTVVLEATLDADGMVSDARVLSGPQELRKAALESVLEWHFTHDAAGSTRQVSIAFQLPAEGDTSKPLAEASREISKARARLEAKRSQDLVDAMLQKELAEKMAEQASELEAGQLDAASELQNQARKLSEEQAQKLSEMLEKGQVNQKLEAERLEQLLAQAALDRQQSMGDVDKILRDHQMEALQKKMAEMQGGLSGFQGAQIFAGRKLKTIKVEGLSTAARDELLAKLPVHVGDILDADAMEKVDAAMKQFDEHLAWSMFTSRDGQVAIRITAPGSGDRLEPPQ